MPLIIKFTVILLLLSGSISMMGTYVDRMLFLEEELPYIYVIDALWLAVVAWLSWLLAVKREDIRVVIMIVFLITVASAIWEFTEYGLSKTLYLYALESILYFIVVLLLSSSVSKGWYEVKS